MRKCLPLLCLNDDIEDICFGAAPEALVRAENAVEFKRRIIRRLESILSDKTVLNSIGTRRYRQAAP